MASNINYLWKDPDAAKNFVTAVSLHSHTSLSQESLGFIPERAEKVPILRWLLSLQENRCKSVKADFANAYWTPPLVPRAAYELERDQIQNKLGLAALVSLSDHDSIEAALMLRLLPETRHMPISVEWSVPYGNTEIHVGIHNLPSSSAHRWLAEMHEYTANPKRERLRELLAGLAEIPDLLVVLNHPLWDLFVVGRNSHRATIEDFLTNHGEFVHALELGGLRSWKENQQVVNLASAFGQLVISGGDRHGCEPNAVLNLTEAKTFAEFVNQIRRERRSNLLFMPQYQQSLRVRMLQTVVDITRDMPDHSVGPRWDDRTFHPNAAGQIVPLSQVWGKRPVFIDVIFKAFELCEARPVSAAARALAGGARNTFRLPWVGEGGETQ